MRAQLVMPFVLADAAERGHVYDRESVEYTPRAYNKRSPFWAKRIRAIDPLPLPSEVNNADDLDQEYLAPNTPIHLSEGDAIIRGDTSERHKWFYKIGIVEQGSLCWYLPDSNALKKLLKGSDLGKAPKALAKLIQFVHVKRHAAQET